MADQKHKNVISKGTSNLFGFKLYQSDSTKDVLSSALASGKVSKPKLNVISQLRESRKRLKRKDFAKMTENLKMYV